MPPVLSTSLISSCTAQLENLAGIFFLYTHAPSISIAITIAILCKTGESLQERVVLPSDLLKHLPNEVRNLLIHSTIFARVREAFSSEFLLHGVEALVHVIAVICGTGASGVRCGCRVHGREEGRELIK